MRQSSTSSHSIEPQHVERAAFVLSCAVPYFPSDSIHVAVVDPKVGTERPALTLVSETGVFIGPDNGVLSAGLTDAERKDAIDGPRRVALPAGKQAYLMSNPAFQHHPLSNTFHARDIFGPAAAHISLGVEPSEVGASTNKVLALPPFRATARVDGTVVGRVIHIDRFGNIITTVRADQLGSFQMQVEIAGREIHVISKTYAESEDLMALVGSSGFLEIALSGRSAADALGVAVGDAVSVLPA